MTFVDKDGEEKYIRVPVGMSMLEAAHENDIELEGKKCPELYVHELSCPFVFNLVSRFT